MYKIITRDNGTCSGEAGGAARTWYDGPGRGSTGQALLNEPDRGSKGLAEAQRPGRGPRRGAGARPLVAGVLGARSVYFKPLVYTSLVIDAEAGQARDGVAGAQLLQTDHTLALRVTQHVLVV